MGDWPFHALITQTSQIIVRTIYWWLYEIGARLVTVSLKNSSYHSLRHWNIWTIRIKIHLRKMDKLIFMEISQVWYWGYWKGKPGCFLCWEVALLWYTCIGIWFRTGGAPYGSSQYKDGLSSIGIPTAVQRWSPGCQMRPINGTATHSCA